MAQESLQTKTIPGTNWKAYYYYTQPPASLAGSELKPDPALVGPAKCPAWLPQAKAAALAANYGMTLESMTALVEKLSSGSKVSLDLETAFEPPNGK